MDRALTWMKAVAKMMPEPKYLAKKMNHWPARLSRALRLMKSGKMAPVLVSKELGDVVSSGKRALILLLTKC
jgi:hypothetical protein